MGSDIKHPVHAGWEQTLACIKDKRLREGKCPECGDKLIVQKSGYKKCPRCEWSACG